MMREFRNTKDLGSVVLAALWLAGSVTAQAQELFDEDSLFAAEEVTLTDAVEGKLPAAQPAAQPAAAASDDLFGELFGGEAAPAETPPAEAAPAEALPTSLDAVVEGVAATPDATVDDFPLDSGVSADAVVAEMLETGDREAAVEAPAPDAAPAAPAPAAPAAEENLDDLFGAMAGAEPDVTAPVEPAPAPAADAVPTPAPAPAADDAFGDLFGGADTAAPVEEKGAPEPAVAAVEETPAPAPDAAPAAVAPAADDAFGDLFGGTDAVAAPAVAAVEETPAPAPDAAPAAAAPAADDAFGDLFGGADAVAEPAAPAAAPEPAVATAEEAPAVAPAGEGFDALVGSLTEAEEATVVSAPATEPATPAVADDGSALGDDMFKSLVDDAKKDMRSAPANAASEVAADPFVGGSPVAPGDGGTALSADKFVAAEESVGTAGAVRGALPPEVVAFEEAERLKREAKDYYATSSLSGAEQALREKDYPRAIKLYEEARNNLPKRPENEPARAQIIKGLGAAYYLQALSQERAGDFENAKISANNAVKFGYVRAEESVVRIQSKIDRPPVAELPPAPTRWKDPDYKLTQSQIKEWLKRGREAYLTGEYDQAMLHFESVLKRDPENKEAIRLMHSAANKQYDRSSMELAATSARMMATVRDTWNPRQYGLHEVPIDKKVGEQTTKPGDEIQRQLILKKMADIRIPEIEFHQANIRDVIMFLVQQSRDFDTEPDKEKRKGVNIILKLETDNAAAAGGGAGGAPLDPFAPVEAPAADGGGAGGADALITFSALDITLKEALDIVVEMAHLKYLVRGNSVMVMPFNVASGDIEHRWYDVLPTAIERLQQLSSAVVGAGPRQGFAVEAGPAAPNEEVDLKVFFQEMGVDWPDKSSIKFVRALGKLVVANTLENLTVFEKVLSILNVVPYQIEIEARFIEVAQLDVDSLGLEWLLNDNWEIAQKKGSAGSPLGSREQIRMDSSAAIGGFTAGNRYLSSDGLTGPGGVPIIDQVASITSVLTNPELTMVLHLLQQRGATDLLSAPKITTQSGQQATIRVVTEYIYPTEFETSGIGGSTGGTTTGTGNTGGGVVGAVVTPSNFQMREVGVILKVTPSVSPEGQMIDLELNPEVVSEPTWRNYGSTYTSYDPNGNPVTQSLNMEQPFFHTRRLETKLLIYNGATVVMGGMITEVRREVDDKVPLLGDIPLIGRLFRSQYESSEKRNLLIFVTARLVDPAGRALDRERVGINQKVAEKLLPGQAPAN